jgi:hypothetical protein
MELKNKIRAVIAKISEKEYLWEPSMKDPKCEHDWRTLNFRFKAEVGSLSALFSDVKALEIEYDFLYCPKCGSTGGEAIEGV